MLGSKFVTAQEAVAAIPDGAYVGIGGFLGIGSAEEIDVAIEKRFLNEGHPRDLTLVHTGGVGDGENAGNNHLAHEGLVKRLIGGHFARIPKLGKMVEEEKIEAFNIPQGILSHLYRDAGRLVYCDGGEKSRWHRHRSGGENRQKGCDPASECENSPYHGRLHRGIHGPGKISPAELRHLL